MLKAVTWCTFTTVSHYSLPSTSVWSAHMKTSQSDTSSKTNKRPAPHLKLWPERCSDYHHINTNSIMWSWGESLRPSWSPLDFRSPVGDDEKHRKVSGSEMQAVLLCGCEGKFTSKCVFVRVVVPFLPLLHVHNTYSVIPEVLNVTANVELITAKCIF